MVSLYLNDIPWGYIHLDADTELRLGYVSPRSIEVKLLWGKARFTTFAMNGKGLKNAPQSGSYSVTIESKNGQWQNVISIGTDFLCNAHTDNDDIISYVLDGMIQYNRSVYPHSYTDLTGSLIFSGDGVILSKASVPIPISTLTDQWWNHKFYQVSWCDFQKMQFESIIQTAKNQWNELQPYFEKDTWKQLTSRDYSQFDLLLYLLGLGLIILLLLLITIISKNHLCFY